MRRVEQRDRHRHVIVKVPVIADRGNRRRLVGAESHGCDMTGRSVPGRRLVDWVVMRIAELLVIHGGITTWAMYGGRPTARISRAPASGSMFDTLIEPRQRP